MSQRVEISGVSKSYAGQWAVRDLSLTIEAGEFFTLLGASGSGKTTTLMMLAGFVEPDSGEIYIGARSMRGLAPERRGLGVVFQSYALFPHMNVAGNVGFALEMRRVARREAAARVQQALALVGLAGYATRRVGQLSGGQQQRVALARALVFEPPVLLLDEPLGALDRQLREQLQVEMKRLHRQLGVTVCHVTHDQEEAMAMSDRIAVLADACLQQVGAPAEVYERPANLFVARFLGESNVLECSTVEDGGGSFLVALAGGVAGRAGAERREGASALMLRPENLTMTPADTGLVPDMEGGLPGRIDSIDCLGASIRALVRTDAGMLVVRMARAAPARKFQPEDPVRLWWNREDARLYDAAGRLL